ncbi:hypothetical protein [Bacteroides sp. Phil13]|uniref:hypothetical protein n=1 Tax=Bacteroides sp. Phil13 TaxID=1929999 RepID=UPI0025805590|nr:hypothetical protein [Bacteroides sp. Phil13]
MESNSIYNLDANLDGHTEIKRKSKYVVIAARESLRRGDAMTKEELEQYVHLYREIGQIQVSIDRLSSKNIPVVAGKVKASSKYFPYTEYRVDVPIETPEIADKVNELIKLKERRLDHCVNQMLDIERFVDDIKDSELRQIFELRYIEGKRMQEVADVVHLDRSVVSRKISNYCNLHTKSQ